MAELAFVALGSNLGDRGAHLASARAALSLVHQTRLVAISRIEETAPLGGMAQPPYLNQMVALRTKLEPEVLLAALQRIERAQGRLRHARWAPRTLDLDIVRFGQRIVHSAGLILPHPGVARRDFWRRELRELVTRLEAA